MISAAVAADFQAADQAILFKGDEVKKLIFIVIAALFLTVAMATSARADSLSVGISGTDNSLPSYGLSYTYNHNLGYMTLEDSTTTQFQTNTPIIALGQTVGPFNSGLVFGANVQQSSGTISGLFGIEAGVSIPIGGPLFVQENNRLLRGAGGVSDSSMSLSLGVRF